MSTIDKCCEVLSDLGAVFAQIKAEEPATTENEQSANSRRDSDRKKILKLFNFDSWALYLKWVNEKLAESGESLESFL